MKCYFIIILISLTTLSFAQEKDFEYEIKHKSESWFSNMKEGVNYFEIKNKFETYVSNRKWEKSKPRSLQGKLTLLF